MARPQPATKNRPSCIPHPRGDWFVKINRGYVELCDGDRAGAFLLNFLEFRTNAFDDPEEAWITISCRALAEELLGLVSASQLCRQVNLLVERGFVEKRDGDNRHSASYRLNLKVVTDALWGLFDDLGNLRDSAFPQKRSVSPGTLSVSPETLKPNPSTCLLSKKVEDDNPPTHFELDRPIDKWAAEQARNHGLTLKINTGKKRAALTEADSPELRERIWTELCRRSDDGGDITDTILGLVGFSNQRRSSGMSRQPLGASHTRSYAPILNQPKVDTALQESPLCREIVSCRNDADVLPRLGDFLNMPPWKVAVLDALRLRDKTGFHERLTETFRNHAEDYSQGVSTDAIVESFFTAEQQRAKQSKGGFDDIREYIASLSA